MQTAARWLTRSVPCLNEPLYSECGIVDVTSSVTADFYRNFVSLYGCRMIARDFSPILKNTKLIVCYLSLLVFRLLDRWQLDWGCRELSQRYQRGVPFTPRATGVRHYFRRPIAMAFVVKGDSPWFILSWATCTADVGTGSSAVVDNSYISIRLGGIM